MIGHWTKLSGIVAWLVLVSVRVPAADAPAAGLRLAGDGRSVEVSMAGLGELRCRWGATVTRAGNLWRMDSSTCGNALEATSTGSWAEGKTVALSAPEAGVELLFWAREVPGLGVAMRAGVRNTSGETIQLTDVNPVLARLKIPDPEAWLLTGWHPRTPVVTSLDDIGTQVRIHEQGSIGRLDGSGMVIGPVGEPVAFSGMFWSRTTDGEFAMDVVTPMDGVRLEPGEVRWGQEVAMVPGKPAEAMGRWAGEVGRSHGARRQAGALAGWNNWNDLAKKEISRELVDVIEVIGNSDGRLRPSVVQMDYNYWDFKITRSLESRWLPECRDAVARAGARFGMHVGVSGPSWPGLDDLPEVVATVARAREAGVGYLKVYFPMNSVTSDGRRTTFEVYRAGWRAIREAAGEEMYLLFADYEPNRAVVGMVDASRVGPDSDRGKIRPAIPSLLRAFPLHDQWFAIDGDTYYTGTDIANISKIEGSWPLVRTWMSMIGLSCGAAITSDPWYWEDFKPYWRNVEVLTPPARERTVVMDLGIDKEWTRLLGHVRRDWGTASVVLLWNPGETERTVTLDFAKAGMDPKQRYAVWSFWDDRYLGVAQGAWTTPRLGPLASQHLVFTPLDPDADGPVLIGSNLHIYCGAAEIRQVTSKRGGFSVELTDAGARDGALYLYSREQPLLDTVTGCTVSGITSAGENVWRVSLHDRVAGAAQRIGMNIRVPTARQPWFWALIATVFLSLLFGAWRYVVAARLGRERALDQERARIARDIHDDLGASLTHIALLGELAQIHMAQPGQVRAHVDAIFRASRKLTRSVDEIVWALNPSNDTLARFAGFVGDFAQEFLQSAKIDCRLSFPATWPDRTLPPKIRHGLFMVIKEALHNVVSHSEARSVRLKIGLDDGLLVVSIADDGHGFDPKSSAQGRPGGGHGQANMRQRMRELGGSIDIQSDHDTGSIVTVSIHL